MKKLLFLVLGGAMLSVTAFSQGWVGNGSSTLYPVNSSLGLTPLSVGIGTSSPTAQLHTTGSLRLTGITQNNTYNRLLVQDTAGYVYWRDVSSIGAGNGWLLTGNTATASNFLGTLNAEKLRFRVNNVERMIIDPNGNVGIGEANPNYALSINTSGDSYGTVDRRFLIGLKNTSTSNDAVTGMRFETNAANPNAFATMALHSAQYNVINDYKNTLLIKTYTDSGIALCAGPAFEDGLNANAGKIRFYTGSRSFVAGDNPYIERMRIAEGGNIGINTKSPTAKLHVKETVRFESLPSGTGDALVIDAAGNVYRSSGAGLNSAAQIVSLQKEVTDLKAQVANLVANRLSALQMADRLVLNGVSPNPATSYVTFKYFIPAGITSAYLHIYNMQGAEIKSYPLPARGQSEMTVSAGTLGKGLYLALITGDGQVSEALRVVTQ
jgi:hypothetical protein